MALRATKVDEAQWGGLQSSPKGTPGFSPIGELRSPDKLKHVLQQSGFLEASSQWRNVSHF
jgi:hypothetical protein